MFAEHGASSEKSPPPTKRSTLIALTLELCQRNSNDSPATTREGQAVMARVVVPRISVTVTAEQSDDVDLARDGAVPHARSSASTASSVPGGVAAADAQTRAQRGAREQGGPGHAYRRVHSVARAWPEHYLGQKERRKKRNRHLDAADAARRPSQASLLASDAVVERRRLQLQVGAAVDSLAILDVRSAGAALCTRWQRSMIPLRQPHTQRSLALRPWREQINRAVLRTRRLKRP